jgi:hypothetical protein
MNRLFLSILLLILPVTAKTFKELKLGVWTPVAGTACESIVRGTLDEFGIPYRADASFSKLHN